MCNMYAPIRAGSDIAFVGGLVNYVCCASQEGATDAADS